MKNIQRIELNDSSKEEILPGFDPAFPYIATCAELDRYLQSFTPWHWHRPVELFYVESGCLEYITPKGKWKFPAGSGGFVNSNILHTSHFQRGTDSNIQLLHLFDPVLLAGERGSRMESKYILPLTTASGVELIPLYPQNEAEKTILEEIRAAFDLDEKAWGYELKLREILTQIWLMLFELARPALEQGGSRDVDDKIKLLMVYVHEHYQEPLTVEQLAWCCHISKRVCFRLFRSYLHMTPVEYIRSYRLQKVCQMLTEGEESITQIAYACGMGSSSYLGKVFQAQMGCSPSEYRKMARL